LLIFWFLMKIVNALFITTTISKMKFTPNQEEATSA
jgi:hypothetical protein